jgi:hypothetical protein
MDLNFSWGDSIDKKPNDATRIFFQNTNGISAANDFAAASEVGFASDANHVDILSSWQKRTSTGVTKILGTTATNT